MEDTALEVERRLVSAWRDKELALAENLLSAPYQVSLEDWALAGFSPLEITRRVAGTLEDLGLDYFVSGSVASSLYGEPRYTQDVDLVVRLRATDLPGLCERLENEFYVSRTAAAEACKHRSSFNLIHLSSHFKVDLFISQERPFDRSRFQRSQPRSTRWGDVRLASMEDVVLAKLLWYSQGQGLLDRQWRDVLGILATHWERLDSGYLTEWADRLEVDSLLARAWQDVARFHEPDTTGESI